MHMVDVINGRDDFKGLLDQIQIQTLGCGLHQDINNHFQYPVRFPQEVNSENKCNERIDPVYIEEVDKYCCNNDNNRGNRIAYQMKISCPDIKTLQGMSFQQDHGERLRK
jgi:hypothetical protein